MRPPSLPRQQPLRAAPPHQRGGYQPVRFTQEMIRRAATAMRENWSNDCFRLATITLQAAIRHEADLLELLRPNHAEPGRRAAATSGLPRRADVVRAVAHVR
jgi:hypothetical protein